MDDELSDLLQYYKLATRFDNGLTVHILDDPDAPPSSPQRLEYWKKIRTFGESPHARVVLQECTSSDHDHAQRAVKMIRLRHDTRCRYKRELEALVKFSHNKSSKYFVKMLGWYASSHTLYIALPYFPTGDLQRYIRQGNQILEDDCSQIISQVLRGLSAMHKESFAHRDIKPQNILIHQSPPIASWWVKLADFGLSKSTNMITRGSSRDIGTTHYMAPELFRVQKTNTDYRMADLWALGITTFFLFTKSLPFQDIHSIIEFSKDPDGLFPHDSLDKCNTSQNAQAFIRGLIKPQPGERLDSDTAMRHAWIHSQLPEIATMPDISNESSEVSSRRSSFDFENEKQPDVLDLTSPSHSKLWSQQTSNSIRATLKSNNLDLVGESTTELPNYANDPLMQSVNSYLSLNNGIDLTIPDSDGHKLFILAVYSGHEAAVKLLIEKGADIETTDEFNRTPFYIAIVYSHIDVASLLIEKGVNPRSTGYANLLFYTVRQGNNPMVKLLIEKGVNIEGANIEGKKSAMTPLCWAIESGMSHTARLLVRIGANVNGAGGQTSPLMLAAKKCGWSSEIARLLRSKGAKLGGS